MRQRMIGRMGVVAAMLLMSWGTSATAGVIDFESFTDGSIHGQQGWTVLDVWGNNCKGGNTPYYDEAVVNVAGNKAWRMSNALTSTSYSDQPFSPTTAQVAGETGSSLWNNYGPNHTSPYNPPKFGANATTNQFHASLNFRSATGTAQTGLQITLSPSAKQSKVRMGWLSIKDNGKTGFDILYADSDANWANPTATVVSGLSYTDWHSITMDFTFADGVRDNKPGRIVGNDIFKIYVDGSLVKTGTTWESYYYENELTASPAPRLQAVDSLLFRASGTAAPGTLGNGLYFDNIELSNTCEVPEPAASVAFSSLGAVGLLLAWRRRKRAV